MARRNKGRANGEGSIYEYPKGSGEWYAQITLSNGRTKRKRAGSQREARKKLAELRSERGQGLNLTAQQPTVAEWCVIWLEKFARNLKPNIREDYRGVIRRYIAGKPIGKRRVNLLTPARVQDWVDALTSSASASTVHNAHARLHKALAVAVKRRYRSENPAAGTELPKVRVKPIQPLSFDQACALLETVAGHCWAPLYRLALNLGLPTIRFHDLRHTCATLLLVDRVPLITVSKILGHSSPAVTAKIYVHALDESKAVAIAGLARRLRRT